MHFYANSFYRNEEYKMKIKKLVAFALTAAMAISVAGCGKKSADQDLEKIKSAGKMVIGYTVFAPMNYTDENGDFVGFETEFSKAVCEKLGVKAEFQEIEWESKETELNSGNIDCIWNGMTITDERKANMSITIPYMENRQVLIVKASDVDKYKASVDGAKVVAEAGSAGEDLAATDEFAKALFTPVDSQATALMEVKAGTADIAIIDYTMAGGSVGEGTSYADLKIVDNDYESEEYGVAFRKNSSATEAVNTAMRELKEDGTLDAIAEKYGLRDLILVK